jgi:hypothetical protein
MRAPIALAVLLLSASAGAATFTTLTPDVIASGTLSAACADASINACPANSTVQVAIAGAGGCGFNIPTSTTLVGTVKADYSYDGVGWVGSALVDSLGNGLSSTTTASGAAKALSVALAGGARYCRVRASAVTSGSAAATVIATIAPTIGNAIQGSGSAGTPAAGVVTVQGISGGQPLAVTGTTGGATTLGDALANPTDAMKAGAYQLGWNGTAWERASSGGTNIDTEAVVTAGAAETEAHNMVFNGTTWDRMRGASSTGLLITPATASAATTAGTCSAVTTSNALLAARTARIGALATSLSTNTVRARYSFSGTATATQMPLEPGQSLSLDGTYKGAVAFISETGASITICVSDW